MKNKFNLWLPVHFYEFKLMATSVGWKEGFWLNLKTTLISRQLVNFTLISSQPWNQTWFQIKKGLAHFENNLDLNAAWIFHRQIILAMCNSRVAKRMWILSLERISWMILLNDSLEWFSWMILLNYSLLKNRSSMKTCLLQQKSSVTFT